MSACYRYTPVPLQITPEGQQVRLLVTREGATELREVTEIGAEVPTLTGTIVEIEDQEILLRVPVAQRQAGFHTVSLDQTIRVPSGEILQVERRDFDRGKTALFVGATVAVSAFVITSIMKAFGGDSSNPGDPPPVEIRIPTPLISIPIGR
jgi:hypothetical protein